MFEHKKLLNPCGCATLEPSAITHSIRASADFSLSLLVIPFYYPLCAICGFMAGNCLVYFYHIQ